MKLRIAAICLLVVFSARAQSTFGNIIGTVTDSTGAVVPRVKVTLISQGENVPREGVADDQGGYQALNLKAGVYTVMVEAAGFKTARKPDVQLDARQTLRVDFVLEIGQVTEQVTVEGTTTVINTETQTISAGFANREILSLPVNFRGNGTTSPFRVLAFLPGVQSDNSFNLAVQGGLPHQTEVSLDGISTVSVRSNGPITDLLPSVEGIAEMKIQGVGNNAEYGQVGDITTTSRGGANAFHGSLFEYMQNRVFDATAFGAVSKPQKTANTFGGSLGGRIVPNRLFFFADFERMSFRRGATIQNTVPTQLQRSGNFTNEPRAVRDPLTGQPYPGRQIPQNQISGIASKVLEFYPLPNFGDPARQASANFRVNRAAPIISNQYDARIDYYISNKQQIFGRWSFKDIDTIANNNFTLPDDTLNNKSRTFVVSHNYTVTPRMINEARFGIAFNDNVRLYAFDGRSIVAGLGFQGLGPFPYNGLSGITFTGATTNFGKGKAPFTFSRNTQFNDNFTWIAGKHTMKFGFDMRRLRAESDLNFFGEDDYGRFAFDGRFSGDDFADFVLGFPFQSQLAKTGLDPNGTSWHYSLYAQDSMRLSQNLTLEFGLRWEYHPPFKDANSNISNFDRSVPLTGRVIIPSDETATRITAPGFVASINACPGPNVSVFNLPCTPFLKASAAGYPEALRFPDKSNYNPRFGFAYRPFSNNKTVVRGGVGVYTMTVLGTVFYSLTGVHGSDIRTFANTLVNGQPSYRWPQITSGGSGVGSTVYGTAYFGTAVQPTYRDPYMMQYSFTLEREIGWNTGIRASYIGNRTVQLPWAPDLNQPQLSTTPFSQRPLTDRPFPYWERIYSRDTGANSLYSSMQLELVRRHRAGLTFNSAWTWAKALSDA
ncbi:MAG: carboxypeptidase regulatory-like domain-containing protein, partial [Bryobacteraceae bacterium]